jgi:hypothetical protein
MADTFIKIATVTVGAGGAASMAFSSIPSTYTDLCIKISGRAVSGGADNILIAFNGSSSSFSSRILEGNGTSASSSSSAGAITGLIDGATMTTSTFANVELYIPNYAGSNNKSFSTDAVTENNATLSYANMWANLWSNTAAINAISLSCSNNFAQYSTATLYGIKNS